MTGNKFFTLALIGAASIVFWALVAGPGRAQLKVEPLPEPKAAPAWNALPKSVVVKAREAIIRVSPQSNQRRGVVHRGVRLPVYEAAPGPGCMGLWYRVYGEAWICARDVDPSSEPPSAEVLPIVPPNELTPWPYGFVYQDAVEYDRGGGEMNEVRELRPGFGVGIAGVRTFDGVKYIETAEGNYIEAASVKWGRVSDFAGVALGPGAAWPVGWVVSPYTWVVDQPEAKTKVRIEKLPRFTNFIVQGFYPENGKPLFLKIGEARWIPAADARWTTTPAEMPKDPKPGDKWIDVDTRQQVIAAYEGDKPVYVTLITSGRYGKESETPAGQYNIWVKVAAIAMDNTDEQQEMSLTAPDAGTGVPAEPHLYSLHDVPWTMFFLENFAIHGAYWHNRFGFRRSHGCVNLSPKDSRWFYRWAKPDVPPGWWAVQSTPNDPGTIVKVR